MTDWQINVAQNGSINFDDDAEARAFDGLRIQASRLFNCEKDNIALADRLIEGLGKLNIEVISPVNIQQHYLLL